MGKHSSKETSTERNAPSVERLYPFATRARVVVTGEALLAKIKKKLHFLLVTTDVSPRRLDELRKNFKGIIILQYYQPEMIESYFGFKQTKVIGFKKSSIAVSIYRELKEKAAKVQQVQENPDTQTGADPVK